MMETILNTIFSPILGLNPLVSILIICGAITGLLTFLNKKLMGKTDAKEVKENMQKVRADMLEAQKSGDKEKTDEQMKKMMGNKIGGMLGNEGLATISFKNTGKKKSFQGYDCHMVLMKLGEDPMMELWMTDKYNIGDDFIKTYQKMGFFKGDMATNFNLKGFPIYTVMDMDMGMGKMKIETTVTKIVATGVSDNEFEVPKGYKKIENPMAF